jgi:hypothetical protein
MKRLKLFSAISILSLGIGTSAGAFAGISQAEADRLGGPELTPLGAERKGNADGTIPEWTGGFTKAPANWKEGEKLADPFPNEKPLFYITAKNYEEYKDKLSPGQIGMLKQYPDTFKMPVYPTHRTAGYPQSVYDEIKAGATKSQLVEGGNGLVKFTSTTPFPIPETGIELIWNHITRFRGYGSLKRTYTQIPVQANGSFSAVLMEEMASWGRDLFGQDTNIVILFLQRILAPPRLEGEVLLVHETLDQVKEPRQAWIYNAGQRRVRRAPNVAYDDPGTASDGLRTADDLDLYNGSPDRYTWELKGKQELYIPYNSYRVMQGDLKYSDILQKGHMNPDYLRYELHRVWVVEATLKPGARHIYARRTFYIDEDTWQISIVDHYDGRGELWKLKEGHALVHYQRQVPWLAVESLHDLVSGRYLTTGLDNEEKGYQYVWDYPAKASDYTPAALRRSSRR